MYDYKATLVRVVDGDTVYLKVDLGFHTEQTHCFRLNGVDTPELHSKDVAEKKLAAEAMSFVESEFMKRANRCRVYSEKTGSFGRWLGDIYFIDEIGRRISLREMLIDRGYGKPYKGRGRDA